jgi:hypothetical protein
MCYKEYLMQPTGKQGEFGQGDCLTNKKGLTAFLSLEHLFTN